MFFLFDIQSSTRMFFDIALIDGISAQIEMITA
jgi:hypothetical protein